MKALLTIACLFCMGYAAQAQSPGVPRSTVLTNAETDTIAQPNATYFNTNQSGVWSAYLEATRLTGTSAGTIYLEATVDSSNHYNLLDSLVLTNTADAQFKNIYVNGKRIVKARVRAVGAGTQTTTIKTWWAKGD